jgi:hypothetical protein
LLELRLAKDNLMRLVDKLQKNRKQITQDVVEMANDYEVYRFNSSI